MYKYDDYDYYTEHETVSEKEKREVLEQIMFEDFLQNKEKCA